MAFFTKKTWVARQGTGLNKFSINGATPVTVVNQPDSVTEQGDALSATNLNNLEQRIYNAFLDVDGVFDNIEDGIVLVGRAKADQNGDIIDETYAKQNGYYAELGAGTAEQLVSTQTVDDDDAYLFRTSGGSADIGNRETDEIVGGTLGVNQYANLPPSSYNATVTVSGTTVTLATTSQGRTEYPLSSNKKGHCLLVIFELVEFDNVNNLCFRTFYNGAYKENASPNFTTTGKKSFIYKPEVDCDALYFYDAYYAEYTIKYKDLQIIDLTAMFGSEIADYILALETANAGAGVAWFRRYFPKPYYPYNAGGLSSVKPSSHDMTGFNQWDEEWVNGIWDEMNNGVFTPNSSRFACKNKIPVVPDTNYNMYCGTNSGRFILFYDANGNYLSYVTSTSFKTPKDCYFITFYMQSAYGTTYKNDICINISWSGTRNGEYEPFELHSYPLDDSTEYRGVPKLDAEGNLYFDGDIYKSSGDVTRRFGIVDLSTLSWIATGSTGRYVYSSGIASLIKKPASDYVLFTGICSPYTIMANNSDAVVGKISVDQGGNVLICVADNTSFTINGILVYELATPTQESANPFTNPQIVNDWGTEQYVDTRDMPIPVGHNTKYMANLRDKLQHLPNLANGDGEYVVKQTGTQMELVKTDNLKKDGYYPTLAVGTADNLKGKGTVGADFTFRTSGGSADIGSGSARIDRINGNTLMLNQKIPTNKKSLTFNAGHEGWEMLADISMISGHKYLMMWTQKDTLGASARNTPTIYYISANVREYMSTLDNLNLAKGNYYWYFTCTRTDTGRLSYWAQTNDVQVTYDNFVFIDLTQMFGSGNEPTVDEFKALFPLDYYDYTEGTPLNFKGTGLKTDGFNQWDEQWESGQYSNTTGEKVSNANYGRSKNYIPVIPSQYYYFKIPTSYGQVMYYAEYDANKNFLRYGAGLNTIVQVGSDCHFITIWMYGWTSYNNDVCINLSWSGIRDGEYEPYWDSTLNLPITTIKGKASGSDESVVIFPDGMMGIGTIHDELGAKKCIVRMGIVDLGSCTWDVYTSVGISLFRTDALGNNIVGAMDSGTIPTNVLASKIYTPCNWQTTKDLSLYVAPQNNTSETKRLQISNASKSSADLVNGHASWLEGIYVVYQLATPIEYTLDEELNLNYRVDDFGTEQLLPENTSTPTTSPMIAEIAYAMNAVDTIRNLPKNYISVASMDQFTSALASKLGLTITKTYDSANGRYNYTIT